MQCYCQVVIRDDVNSEDQSNLIFVDSSHRNSLECFHALEDKINEEIVRLCIGQPGYHQPSEIIVFVACQDVADGPMNTASYEHPASYRELNRHL